MVLVLHGTDSYPGSIRLIISIPNVASILSDPVSKPPPFSVSLSQGTESNGNKVAPSGQCVNQDL